MSARDVADAIKESLRAVFAQKGIAITEDLLRECANNSAQSVVFLIEESKEVA